MFKREIHKRKGRYSKKKHTKDFDGNFYEDNVSNVKAVQFWDDCINKIKTWIHQRSFIAHDSVSGLPMPFGFISFLLFFFFFKERPLTLFTSSSSFYLVQRTGVHTWFNRTRSRRQRKIKSNFIKFGFLFFLNLNTCTINFSFLQMNLTVTYACCLVKTLK